MATNQYNESPADLETVPAGTVLYRILAADAGYAANSFNPHPRPAVGGLSTVFAPVLGRWRATGARVFGRWRPPARLVSATIVRWE